MGPRPFSRGNPVSLATNSGACSRFNGATAFQPWKSPLRVSPLPYLASFNGATAFQPWK